MAKKTFVEQLKKWRKEKEESYAKAIMEPPSKATVLQLLNPPEVDLILGMRREGKTALAHKMGEDLNHKFGMQIMVHLPTAVPPNLRTEIQKLLPSYMKVTTRLTDWQKDSGVIYDETSQSAHARRTQSSDAVELDNLIGVSGQRNQTLIFICHHTKKLDPNIVREVNKIIWKRPSYGYQLFERDELSEFTMKAFDFFEALRKGRKLTPTLRQQLKKNALVLNMDEFRFNSIENKLPKHWSDKLSCLFQDIQNITSGRVAPGY
jgi:hypothetical protein